MATRLAREESQERTRTALIAAARRVFLERGFHGASISEIADAAGYTTGAVYANFGGKDDLFLEMLDQQLSRSVGAQTEAVMGAETFSLAVRAAARELYQGGTAERTSTPLLIEFWTHASRDPALRKRLLERHEQQISEVAATLTALAERHGVRYRIPVHDVVRGGGAISRGLRLERLLDPSGVPIETFEEIFHAYVTGLAEPADRARRRKGDADDGKDG